MKYSTHVFDNPDGGQILVTVFPDRATIAFRDRMSSSWGPPQPASESNEWEAS